MGSRAVEALLARLHHRHGQGGPTAQESIVFPTELVWRASVSAPAATPRIVPST